MSNRIITLEELELERMRPMAAHQFVNQLSWHDIGNRDEQMRDEFVSFIRERDKQVADYAIALFKHTNKIK